MATAEASRKAYDEAGQHLIIGLEESEIKGHSIEILKEIKPLGIILFARNLPDLQTVLHTTHALHRLDPELIIAIDHEGGRVQRLPEGFTRFPAALDMVRNGEPGLLRQVGCFQGRELRAAGFDLNFAPVLDVHTNPANPVIAERAFGTTPEEVVHNALPYLQGLAEGGVLGCGKHFPGHGDTELDSHLELPRLSHDMTRLRRVELLPFARAAGQGLPMIMTAHLLVEAIDPMLPASLSPAVIDGLLRGELGFSAMVVSDDLEMQAITDHFGVGQAAVRAIEAGSDAVLICEHRERIVEAHTALSEAIEAQRITVDALAASTLRRKRLRKRLVRLARTSATPATIGAAEHRSLAERLAG